MEHPAAEGAFLDVRVRPEDLRRGELKRRGRMPSSVLSPGMDERLRPAETMEVEMRARRTGGELFVEGSARCGAKAVCDRCLAEFPMDLSWRFSACMLESHLETDYDVRPEIRESFYLQAPPRFLCRPDCRGICPHCGQNLNEGRCEHAPS